MRWKSMQLWLLPSPLLLQAVLLSFDEWYQDGTWLVPMWHSNDAQATLTCCDLLQGSIRPLPRKLGKMSEKGGQKDSEKRAKNDNFSSFFGVVSSFLTVFPHFRAFFRPRGQEGPRNPLSDFSRSFPERGLFDPLQGPTISQVWTVRAWEYSDSYSFSGAKKEPQSQKIARTAPKNFLNNSRGLPVITHQNKAFEANRTRKFTRKFGEIFVAKVLWGTLSVPDFLQFQVWGQRMCLQLQLPGRFHGSQVETDVERNGGNQSMLQENTLWFKMITGRINYFRIIFGGSTGKSCKSPRGYYRGGSYRTGAHTGDYFWGIIFGGSTGKSCNSPGAVTWKNVYRIILVIISP